jgi:hypothetical protein
MAVTLSSVTSPTQFIIPDECPVHDINTQLLALRKETNLSKDKGVLLFERLIKWLSIYKGPKDDPEYMASTTTIFTIVLDLLEKGLITPDEKNVMFDRAFQVIVMNYPDQKIKDQDLVDFLESLGFGSAL